VRDLRRISVVAGEFAAATIKGELELPQGVEVGTGA
jgi:hypothetical protein